MKDFIPVCEPFLNGNELKYVTDAVSSGWISSSGSYVKDFEEKFAEYCGVKYAVGVCNGTVALHLALTALGIGKGTAKRMVQSFYITGLFSQNIINQPFSYKEYPCTIRRLQHFMPIN